MQRAIEIIKKRKEFHGERWSNFNRFGKQDQASGDEDGAKIYFDIAQSHADANGELDIIIDLIEKEIANAS